MTKEEADRIAELFKCDVCAPTFRISDDLEKMNFQPCEKHKDIANLNYFKKMNFQPCEKHKDIANLNYFKKMNFQPCEKHKDIANLNYFKKMNMH